MYRRARQVYTTLIPARLRRLIYDATPGRIRQVRSKLIRRLERSASHDDIYNAEYYARDVDPLMLASAGAIADSIVAAFHPRRVVDVGCGTGALLMALRDRGIEGTGLEYSQAARDLCRERGLNVHRFDLENDTPPPLETDLVISTEVAEHLPEALADRFVEVLCGFGVNIFMTAATPGQGGADHVNEQPHSYWIAKMEARGMVYDESTTNSWRHDWAAQGVEGCYARNAMVFRRSV